MNAGIGMGPIVPCPKGTHCHPLACILVQGILLNAQSFFGLFHEHFPFYEIKELLRIKIIVICYK